MLLIFIPLGWILYLVRHKGGVDSISDTVIFIMNFIAIIPLAGLLGFATEEAAMRLGQTMGGLLNATLGNAVELIVAILALIKVSSRYRSRSTDWDTPNGTADNSVNLPSCNPR